MSKMSGDLVEIGIAKEAVRGTVVPPTYGIRWGDLEANDKALESVEETRSGIEEDSRDVKVVGTYAEGSLGGPVRDRSIGFLLLSLMGTNADSVAVDSLYTHTFTVQQGVNHQSLTIHRRDPNASYDFPLAVVSDLEMSVEPDKHVMFSAGFRSKAGTATLASLGTFTVTIAAPAVVSLTGHGLVTGDVVTLATTIALPTGLTAGTQYYVVWKDANSFWLATSLANALAGTKITTTGSQSGTHTLTRVFRYVAYSALENVFLPQHCTFKLAATAAALTAADAVSIKGAKVTLSQEVEDDRRLGAVAQADVVNKGFTATVEIQYVREADTHATSLLAGTAQALRIDIVNADVLIGTASHPSLRFDFHQVVLESADTDVSKGDLAVQTLVFRGTYKEADAAMVKAYLANALATVT
jgi:hypothetical protein